MNTQKGSLDVLIGLAWGDEGKGKIVHRLAPDYDLVARFHGGPNAGHTIIINGEDVVLNTIPCGIFSSPALCGDGMVANPILLKAEIEKVTKYGADSKKNLFIGNGIHLILPTHILLDKAEEASKGIDKVGSTSQGIGPVYRDKPGRVGIRMGDIFEADFEEKFWKLTKLHILTIKNVYNYPLNEETDINIPAKEWLEAVEFLKQFKNNFVSCSAFANKYLNEGKNILAEGAQAVMLDNSFGTYPFVTSSRTLASAAACELGVPAQSIRKVIGVMKAYTTRVGSGPFPTKITGELEDAIRAEGHEYGARTKRPRDIGWLDFPAIRYAIALNGVTEIVITKLDILDILTEIKICTEYMVAGVKKEILDFNMVTKAKDIEPVYHTMPGWKGSVTAGAVSREVLPKQAQDYIAYLTDMLKVPVSMISVGPGKDEIIKL